MPGVGCDVASRLCAMALDVCAVVIVCEHDLILTGLRVTVIQMYALIECCVLELMHERCSQLPVADEPERTAAVVCVLQLSDG